MPAVRGQRARMRKKIANLGHSGTQGHFSIYQRRGREMEGRCLQLSPACLPGVKFPAEPEPEGRLAKKNPAGTGSSIKFRGHFAAPAQS